MMILQLPWAGVDFSSQVIGHCEHGKEYWCQRMDGLTVLPGNGEDPLLWVPC